jgi:uncharacterized protein YbjT (DUF2867 family)
MLLLCGGTGELGGRIASRLAAHQIPFRTLVRRSSDASRLSGLGAQVAVGDLTDRESLDGALVGVRTVVTTANAIGRLLAGGKDGSIDAVDRQGNRNLVQAAEDADVERFVFVSMAGLTDDSVRRAPLAAAKRHTEQLLRASTVRPVIVRPDKLQEIWLMPVTGIDPAKRRAVIFGRGRARETYAAMDDVAEACVRVSQMSDPPAELDFGGPDELTRHEVVDLFERAFGIHFRRLSVPRAALALAAHGLRRVKPEIASVLGMALSADIDGSHVDAEPLRQLGIQPRSAAEFIASLAARPRAHRP